MEQIYIGTSGWSYDDWEGSFYPEETKNADFLNEYKETFKKTEINNTFYTLPSPKRVENWRDIVSENFIFSVKDSRYITHNKKLKDPKDSTKKFFKAIEPLSNKIGPILFQLPPHWHVNAERLENFIKILPSDYRYTFEFRDKSWLCNQIYHLLEDNNIALCMYDYKGYRSPEKITADFIYMRLHGPEKAYEGSYDGRTLSAYAKKFKAWKESGHNVFCYFDNDKKALRHITPKH